MKHWKYYPSKPDRDLSFTRRSVLQWTASESPIGSHTLKIKKPSEPTYRYQQGWTQFSINREQQNTHSFQQISTDCWLNLLDVWLEHCLNQLITVGPEPWDHAPLPTPKLMWASPSWMVTKKCYRSSRTLASPAWPSEWCHQLGSQPGGQRTHHMWFASLEIGDLTQTFYSSTNNDLDTLISQDLTHTHTHTHTHVLQFSE